MDGKEFLTPKEARKLLADLARANADRIGEVRAQIAATEAARLALRMERADRYVLLMGFRRLRDDVESGRFKVTGAADLETEASKRGANL